MYKLYSIPGLMWVQVGKEVRAILTAARLVNWSTGMVICPLESE